MSEVLKPCPMCGSDDVKFGSPGGDESSYDFVICNGCGVSAGRADCEGDLHQVWNRRATPPSLSTAEGERIRKLEAVVVAAAEDLGALHNALGLPENDAIDADVMIVKVKEIRAALAANAADSEAKEQDAARFVVFMKSMLEMERDAFKGWSFLTILIAEQMAERKPKTLDEIRAAIDAAVAGTQKEPQ